MQFFGINNFWNFSWKGRNKDYIGNYSSRMLVDKHEKKDEERCQYCKINGNNIYFPITFIAGK